MAPNSTTIATTKNPLNHWTCSWGSFLYITWNLLEVGRAITETDRWVWLDCLHPHPLESFWLASANSVTVRGINKFCALLREFWRSEKHITARLSFNRGIQYLGRVQVFFESRKWRVDLRFRRFLSRKTDVVILNFENPSANSCQNFWSWNRLQKQHVFLEIIPRLKLPMINVIDDIDTTWTDINFNVVK